MTIQQAYACNLLSLLRQMRGRIKNHRAIRVSEGRYGGYVERRRSLHCENQLLTSLLHYVSLWLHSYKASLASV